MAVPAGAHTSWRLASLWRNQPSSYHGGAEAVAAWRWRCGLRRHLGRLGLQLLQLAGGLARLRRGWLTGGSWRLANLALAAAAG